MPNNFNLCRKLVELSVCKGIFSFKVSADLKAHTEHCVLFVSQGKQFVYIYTCDKILRLSNPTFLAVEEGAINHFKQGSLLAERRQHVSTFFYSS